ncbi:MAG: carboxypeptidase-like regulatory domain-containing protein [Bacteroidota bacterium]
MLSKSIFFGLILILPFWAKSQSFSGRIVDKETGQAIAGVNIIELNSKRGVSSNKEGFFTLKNIEFPLRLRLTHVAYKTYERLINSLDEGLEQQNQLFQLDLDSKILEGPEILPDPLPELVFSNELRHVCDFDFTESGLCVLAYQREKSLRSADQYENEIYENVVVYSTDFENRIRDSIPLNSGQFEFKNKYGKYPILSSDKHVILFKMDSARIDTIQIKKSVYSELMEPKIDSIGDVTYLSNFNPSYPAFEYYTLDSRDSTYTLLRYISDKFGMELMRSEFKYLSNRDRVDATNMSIRTGIDRKIIGAYMRGFDKQAYFETPNAPLFVMNDTVLIFDHHSDRLMKYSKWNNAIDSIEFNYHKRKRYDEKWMPNNAWDGEVYLDDIQQTFWTSYSRNGFTYLKKIDSKNAEVSGNKKLHYKYAERIRIRDGYAYYIYRPFESSQKKFLYREKINY